MRKKYMGIILMLLVVSIFAVGCGNNGADNGAATEDSNGEKITKDTLTIGVWEDLATMDPQSQNRASNWMVQRMISDKLVHENADGSVEPRLATEWEFLDDLTLEMKLRDDVKFTNGAQFTAEDVLFTIQRGLDDPISASTFKFFDPENSKIVDDYTVQIKFTEPYAPVFNTLSGGRGGIVSKEAVEEMGVAEHARNPVGSGPYKLEEWSSGSEIRLVRNEDYWGEPAKTENLVFKIIPEGANRVIELETGGVDIIYDVDGIDVERVEELENASIVMGESNRYMLVTFSMQDEALADEDVRYALSYALDKEAIVEAIYSGTAKPATGMYPSNVFGFKELGVMPYDLDKAKELMKKAGYEDGLKLKFNYEDREIDRNIAEIIQNMWGEIGVELEFFQMDSSTYTAQGNEFQAGLRAGNANEPSNILIIYDSEFGDKIASNDDKLDAMLSEAMTIYDNEKRAEAYEEIQEYLYEIRYTIPLAYTPVIFGVSDKVEGFEIDPLYQMDLQDIVVYE